MVNLRDKNGRSLYFSNRSEYYRRIRISQALQEYYKKKDSSQTSVSISSPKPVTYFLNFDIAEAQQGDFFYVRGSLSSMKKIPREDAIKIIRANLPKGYTPTNFYDAEEEGEQKQTLLVLLREDNQFFYEVIHV